MGELMKSTEIISIREVKREARQLYRGKFSTAIKINILPIIFAILTTMSILMISYGLFADLGNISQTDSDVLTTENSTLSQIYSVLESVLSQAVQLIIVWSVSWTLIEWYEKPSERPKFNDVFQIFSRGNFFHTLILTIVQSMLLFLWTILFVFPGIVKLFAYSQTYFAYKVDIENGTRQAQLTDYITISRRLMNGRKWELFLLELSFIGWHILGILTAGLAYIYVVPYLNATRVAYSRHLFTLAMVEKVSA